MIIDNWSSASHFVVGAAWSHRETGERRHKLLADLLRFLVVEAVAGCAVKGTVHGTVEERLAARLRYPGALGTAQNDAVFVFVWIQLKRTRWAEDSSGMRQNCSRRIRRWKCCILGSFMASSYVDLSHFWSLVDNCRTQNWLPRSHPWRRTLLCCLVTTCRFALRLSR